MYFQYMDHQIHILILLMWSTRLAPHELFIFSS